MALPPALRNAVLVEATTISRSLRSVPFQSHTKCMRPRLLSQISHQPLLFDPPIAVLLAVQHDHRDPLAHLHLQLRVSCDVDLFERFTHLLEYGSSDLEKMAALACVERYPAHS